MEGKTNRKRACIFICSLMILSGILTGCWDRREINDDAFVLATGIDAEENGRVRVTVLIPLAGQMGGNLSGSGGTSGDKSYYVDSESGYSIWGIVQNLQRRMPRRMDFSHRRVLVIGESMARRGVSPIFDSTVRHPETRLTTYLVVSEGKASDLLNADPKLERHPAEAIRELAKMEETVEINMKSMAQSLSQTGADPIIVMMRTKKTEKSKTPSQNIEVSGYAQFRYDKMVGKLSGDAFRGIMWLRNEITPYSFTLPLENGKITVHIRSGRATIDPKLENGKLHYDIKINAEMNVMDHFPLGMFGGDTQAERLSRLTEQRIKSDIRSAIEKIVQNRADSAGFGQMLYRKYPREWNEKYMDDWYAHLREASFSIDSKVFVGKTGLITERLGKREKR